MDQGRHRQRSRRRRRVDSPKLIWLAEQATGDLADALDRDLRTDRLALDDLGWRGLWAYITAAPPGTALYHAQAEGWDLGARLDAEQLDILRELLWRYNALHFKGGKDEPYPQPLMYPGKNLPAKVAEAKSWETVTADELISPQVKALLAG